MSEEIPEFYFALNDNLQELCNKYKTCEIKDFLPTQATTRDTGFDVRSASEYEIAPGQYFKINLGITAFCPSGWWLSLHPRSSTFLKKRFHTHIGIIDEDFNHNLHLLGQYVPDSKDLNIHSIKVEFGERIGQLVPVKRQSMIINNISLEEINKLHTNKNSARTGGYGSTGNF